LLVGPGMFEKGPGSVSHDRFRGRGLRSQAESVTAPLRKTRPRQASEARGWEGGSTGSEN